MHKSREAIKHSSTMHAYIIYYPILHINSFYDIKYDDIILTIVYWLINRIRTYWFFSTDLLSKLCRPTFLPALGDFLGYNYQLQIIKVPPINAMPCHTSESASFNTTVYNLLTLNYIQFTWLFPTLFYYYNKMGAYTRQLIILSHGGQWGRPVWLPTAGIQWTRIFFAQCSLYVVHEVPRVLGRDRTGWAGPKQLVCLPLQVLHQYL